MKIVWITDMDVTGSGYKNLSVPLCEQLTKLGHEIKVLGINYKGEEHFWPFSVIPYNNISHLPAMVINLQRMWGYDVIITALDIPLQERIMASIPSELNAKYWGIFPVEAPPLCTSWASVLHGMHRQFIISEFGTEEARKKEVPATYLPVGVDFNSWKVPTKEERNMLRGSYGFTEDEFVILTVADNQERKFISRTAQIINKFRDTYKPNLRWILVTRQHSPVGWKLNDLVSEFNLVSEFLPFERGIPFKELWALYAMSDCFLLTSKAEGIGIPVLEAMSVGIPVAATDCTGMRESLKDGRGFLIKPEEHEVPFIDPFGNGYRYFASVSDGVRQLHNIWKNQGTREVTKNARGYIETLTWERSAGILHNALNELENEND